MFAFSQHRKAESLDFRLLINGYLKWGLKVGRWRPNVQPQNLLKGIAMANDARQISLLDYRAKKYLEKPDTFDAGQLAMLVSDMANALDSVSVRIAPAAPTTVLDTPPAANSGSMSRTGRIPLDELRRSMAG